LTESSLDGGSTIITNLAELDPELDKITPLARPSTSSQRSRIAPIANALNIPPHDASVANDNGNKSISMSPVIKRPSTSSGTMASLREMNSKPDELKIMDPVTKDVKPVMSQSKSTSSVGVPKGSLDRSSTLDTNSITQFSVSKGSVPDMGLLASTLGLTTSFPVSNNGLSIPPKSTVSPIKVLGKTSRDVMLESMNLTKNPANRNSSHSSIYKSPSVSQSLTNIHETNNTGNSNNDTNRPTTALGKIGISTNTGKKIHVMCIFDVI
jgi:hypothetical protein